jgi:1-acyl-sn-glycerol-3-phosphate acyltransferase
MLSLVSKIILKVWGWKFEGVYPNHLKKFVIVVIPHTSSWDFPLGLLVRSALKGNGKYLGKDSLFRPPFGAVFRWLGGIPVDRSKSNNFVQAVIDMMNASDELGVVIAPEGTRKMVETLKTGFYYIAKGANAPVVMCKFDWGRKVIGFSQPYHLSSEMQADLRNILAYFRDVKGYHPEFGINIDQYLANLES